MTAKPPAPMAVSPWEDDLTIRIGARFGAAVTEFSRYVGQEFLVVQPAVVLPLIEYLKLEEDFDYLVDLTAVDYPARPERFELVYILYSYGANRRIRIKTRIGETEPPASITSVHKTANWLEREVYDMFGIQFAGHPALRRILLPEEWSGHPLRKEYGITQMDQSWVKNNLGIESGQ